jgi:hypothetical protein
VRVPAAGWDLVGLGGAWAGASCFQIQARLVMWAGSGSKSGASTWQDLAQEEVALDCDDQFIPDTEKKLKAKSRSDKKKAAKVKKAAAEAAEEVEKQKIEAQKAVASAGSLSLTLARSLSLSLSGLRLSERGLLCGAPRK